MSRLMLLGLIWATLVLNCLGDDSDAQAVRLSPNGESKPASVWMKQKLSLSQDIFAGLTRGNLVQVKESAEMLKLMDKIESFARGRSDTYRTQMRLFQFANNEIIEGASEGNLERVTLAYTQLTISCVSCHKHLRRGR